METKRAIANSMAHLLTPHDYIGGNHDLVPLLSNLVFDGGAFLTYPTRQQMWTPPTVIPQDITGLINYEHFNNISTMDLEIFCQTWLFFGLLQEILGEVQGYSKFVRENSIDTTSLVATIDIWIQSTKAIRLGDARYENSYNHKAICLQQVNVMLSFIRWRDDKTKEPSFSKPLRRLIASIGEILSLAINYAFDIGKDSGQNQCHWSWKHYFYDAEVRLQMLHEGWCLSDISHNEHAFEMLATHYFISKMRRPDAAGLHTKCSIQTCEALQTRDDQYIVRHRTHLCDCGMISIDGREVQRILNSGSYPVVNIGQLNGNVTLQVASAANEQYVAISHVRTICQESILLILITDLG